MSSQTKAKYFCQVVFYGMKYREKNRKDSKIETTEIGLVRTVYHCLYDTHSEICCVGHIWNGGGFIYVYILAGIIDKIIVWHQAATCKYSHSTRIFELFRGILCFTTVNLNNLDILFSEFTIVNYRN